MSNIKTIGDFLVAEAEDIDPFYDRIPFWDVSAPYNKTKAVTIQTLGQMFNVSGAVQSVNGLSGIVTLTSGLIGAAPASHTHTFSSIVNLQEALDEKQTLHAALTQISGLTPTLGHFLRRGASSWESGLLTDSDIPAGIARMSAVESLVGDDIAAHAALLGNGNHIPSSGITNTEVSSSANISWSKINKSGSGVNDIGGLGAALDSKLDDSEKGAPFGLATLDTNGKLSSSQIPSSLVGSLTYKGTWNASTNSPSIPVSSVNNVGNYYIVINSVSPSHGYPNVPAVDFNEGDWIVSNGASWDKVDNTESVVSVFGRQGVVTPQSGDYNTDQVPEGDTNKYYTNNRARQSISTSSPLVYDNSTGALSIQQANNSQSGFLTSTDWSTFNNKQSALGFTPLNPANNLSEIVNPATARSNLELAAGATASNTDGLPEGSTNKYFSNSLARSAISAGSGLNYNPSTGVMSLPGQTFQITYDQSAKPSSPSNNELWLERTSTGYSVELWQWNSTKNLWISYDTFQCYLRAIVSFSNNANWVSAASEFYPNTSFFSMRFRGDGVIACRSEGVFTNCSTSYTSVNYPVFGWSHKTNDFSTGSNEFVSAANYTAAAQALNHPIIRTITDLDLTLSYSDLTSYANIQTQRYPTVRLVYRTFGSISSQSATVWGTIDYKLYRTPA